MINTFKKLPFIYSFYLKRSSGKQALSFFSVGLKSLLGIRQYPLSVILAINYDCQCDCLHCGIADYKEANSKLLDFEEIKKVIVELRKLGVINITLSGGEPLLRKDIFDIVEFISSQGLFVTLDSNGVLLSEENVSKLIKNGLSLVKVSMDSSSEECHDKNRKMPGCFKKAINGLRCSVKLGLPCVMQTYITKEAVEHDDLQSLGRLAKELGVKNINIHRAKYSGRYKQNISGREELSDYMGKYAHLGNVLYSNVVTPVLECSAILTNNCYISAFGEVTPCMFMPLGFGNIRNGNFKEIWKKMIMHPMYRLSPKCCPVNDLGLRKEYGI